MISKLTVLRGNEEGAASLEDESRTCEEEMDMAFVGDKEAEYDGAPLYGWRLIARGA